MELSFIILLLVLFLVFMFTAEGISDSAKRISMFIGIVFVLWIIIKIL
jgi:hypothetical protein